MVLAATLQSLKADFSSVSPPSFANANARNVSFLTLYGGQFTISAPLMLPNYLDTPTDAAPQFL